ncbi:hypothetical protein [Blautia obeum]|jgi:hypothetical protein|uniref:hypothetical protein n=1 Tax=Blautia obeum TaxID=40520 RepID=UPI000E4D11D5|nr:hypothetical protein [Blautia obeum]RGS15841.1 hypothetical protein DWY10_09570 [Blautia obeum]
MSKSVLVMDTPENCGKCKFISGFWCRAMNGRRVPNNDVIPNWCPLKPLPEKKEYIVPIDNVEANKDIIAVGWNACIDKITGKS